MTDKTKPTVELGPLQLPPRCITPGALRSLASAMQRLEAFHNRVGGRVGDEPCLLTVAVEEGRVVAEVESGSRSFFLDYIQGHWVLRPVPNHHK